MTLIEKVKRENIRALQKLKEKLERKEKQVNLYKFLLASDVRKFSEKIYNARFLNYINDLLVESGFEKINLDDKDSTMFKINLYLKEDNKSKFFNSIKIPLTEGKFNIYEWNLKLHEWYKVESSRADEIQNSIDDLRLNNANLCDIVDRIENSLDKESIALLKTIL